MLFGRNITLWIAAIAALLAVAISVFGLQLTNDQVGQIMLAVGAVLALFANQTVTGSLFGRGKE